MPALTKARRKAAVIARETGVLITTTSALIGTRQRITARGWAIVNCIAAITAPHSNMATTQRIRAVTTTAMTIVIAITTVTVIVIKTAIATTIVTGAATGIAMASTAGLFNCGRRR